MKLVLKLSRPRQKKRAALLDSLKNSLKNTRRIIQRILKKLRTGKSVPLAFQTNLSKSTLRSTQKRSLKYMLFRNHQVLNLLWKRLFLSLLLKRLFLKVTLQPAVRLRFQQLFLAEEPGDTLGDIIGELVGAALTADTIPEPVPDKDETEIIMEALNSLDYEPVLSDTVLDLLVGKAATREKAVIATISRLENAMAGVVNDVEAALQHHNTTSALVVSAKLNAQSISTATSKESARELLEELLVSSSAVQAAFEEGELVTERVTTSFNKLSEIIDKAEQFNLKGPVGAARALLHKSRDDYFTSCEIAQENQVDHALLTHYRTSVVNRKKVLDKELEVLREHFPNQHLNLNQTFESAGSHHAQVDELNTLITYLSNKVARLESDIEARQSAELEKLRTVAEAQKEEDNKILEERLRAQADQLKYKYEVRQQEEVELAVAAARDEAARHAAKQAEIMKQEAREVTEKQIRDLTSFWSDEAALRESVVEVEYQCKLEKSNSLLRGVAGMLDVTSQRYDVLAYNQRLLNLTTAIFDSLNSGETVDVERLKASVSTLKTEFNDDPLICAVTNSFPSRHISSFSRLKDRLSDLDRQCRKVSLMTSEECGVGSRVLSRVMSALTLHDPNYDMTPQDGGSITLYFLQKAENEMKNNNLDLATRYLNQLIGEPKNLATDWLNDARDLLESRQSANVLLNYAKSRNNT